MEKNKIIRELQRGVKFSIEMTTNVIPKYN